MINNGGWIKLHRKTLDSQVFQNEGLLKVWVWCLLKAGYEGRWVSVKTGRGFSELWLDPGQFIFGRESASNELGMPPSTVRNRIAKIESMGNIKILDPQSLYSSHFTGCAPNQDSKKDRQFSIIYIVNWNSYQYTEKKEDSEKDRQRTAKGHKQEGKEFKEEKHPVDSAKNIYDFYLSEIQPDQKSKQRALSNIRHFLKTYSPDDLQSVILNYKSICKDREPKYRKDPANFFGKREKSFIDFLPENFTQDQPEVRKPTGSALLDAYYANHN